MRFRLGLAVGLAAGYVLGAKAGRQRYEEIREMAGALMETETAQHLLEGATRAWHAAQEEFPVAQQMGEVLDLADRFDEGADDRPIG